MISQIPQRNLSLFAAAIVAVPLSSAWLAPAQAQMQPQAQVPAQGPLQGDPDAANAPIADRETANVQAKKTRPAPQLAEIGVPRTNYPIPAGAIFASPTGSAKASGLNRNAPTTLAHAIETAPVGATIVLRAGDYRGISGMTIPHKMTLQAAPGEVAWIKGSDVVSGFAPDGGHWSAAWDKKLIHPNANDADPNNPLAMDTDMVFVAGKSLKQVAKPEEVVAGTFCVDTTAKKLILADDPTGKTVESTVAVKGFDIKGKEASGTVIRGLGFAHFAELTMEAYSPQLTLENNTFAWNAVRGLRLNGADSVMRGNTLACNGLGGMNGFYNDRLLFENNRVMFNNIEGFRATWSASGTKFARTKNATFRGNTFENNQAAALWFDISCINNNVIGNTVRSNKGLGVFYELCHGGLVAFNVFEDNGVGLMLSDTSGLRAWNNTFLDNSKAVTVKDTPRVNDAAKNEGVYPTAAKAEDIAAGVTWITANNEFHNNLFAGARNTKDVLFEAGQAPNERNARDMIRAMNSNAYVRTRPNFPALLVRWNEGDRKLKDFTSLPDFRASQTGYETNAVLLEGKPLFAAPNDYHLAANSPLLKAGTPLPPEVQAAAKAAGIKLPSQGAPIGAMGTVAGGA